jgi:hypothetical protein
MFDKKIDNQFPPEEDIEYLRKQDEEYCSKQENKLKNSLIKGKVLGKGKVVCLREKDPLIDGFPTNKEDVACHLAIVLDDECNLAWYEKLAREKRRDLLKNCLRFTLVAFSKGLVKKSKPAYFAGVVKEKVNQQQRIKRYKNKHPELYIFGTRDKLVRSST